MSSVGLIVKSILIAYILVVAIDYIFLSLILNMPSQYWGLFRDDVLATLLCTALLTPLGLATIVTLERHRQR